MLMFYFGLAAAIFILDYLLNNLEVYVIYLQIYKERL